MLFKKLLAAFFALAYLSFVALQYNDPDPALWMAIYGIAALLCFGVVAGKTKPAILWAAAVLYTIGAVFAWPEKFEGVQIGGGDIKNIEEARESLGLLLCTLSFIILALLQHWQNRQLTQTNKH